MNPRCPVRFFAVFVAMLALVWVASGAPSDLDVSFGTAGKVATDFGGGDDAGNHMAVQSDGKIVVAGSTFNGSQYDVAVVRYAADGALDSSFGTGGKVTTDFAGSDDAGYSVVVQGDGKVVVAGYASGSSLDFALVRYEADGTLDGGFGSGGKVITDFGGSNEVGHGVAVQSDGKLVVAGDAYNGSDYDFALVRYNSDGTLDASFGTGGRVLTDFGGSQDYGRSVAVLDDGKIIVVGYSGTYPISDFALARYHADGTLDTSFGTGGRVVTDFDGFDDVGVSVVLQSDGKMVVAGYSLAGDYDFALVRYHTNGTLDSSFGTGGKVTTNFGSYNDLGLGVAVQGDGKILVAGYSSMESNAEAFALARYTSSGALDVRFGSGGKVITSLGSSHDVGRGLALQGDGKIVVTGYSGSYPDYDFALARYLGGEPPPTPEIDVQQPVGTSLANGSRVDFGGVIVGSAADLTFTLANSGTAALTLTGSPDKVAVAGADANLFTVTTTPASPVVAGGATVFTVRFAPTSVGMMSATLTIASNDGERDPFTLTLEASGHLASPLHTKFLAAGGMTADAAPGAGVFPGLPADAKLASFGPPATDDEGDIAFLAKWTSATGGPNGKPTKGSGLFLNGQCLAVIGGEASAMGAGAKWKSFSDPVVDAGRVAVIAKLSTGTSAVVVGNGSGLQKIAASGDLAPEALPGSTAKFKGFKSVALVGNAAGFLAQRAAGTGTPKVTAADDLGCWVRTDAGSLSLAWREGGEIDGRKIRTLTAFTGGNGSPGMGRGWLTNSASGPQVLARVGFTDGNQAMLVNDLIGGGVTTLTRTKNGGTGVANTDFASYSVPARNANRDTAFLASLALKPGAVTRATAPAIFASSPAAPSPLGSGFAEPDIYAPVARLGDDAGMTGGKFSVLKDPVLAADGALAFPATIKGSMVKGLLTKTLWWRPANEALALLAQGGGAHGVPTDLPTGAQWSSFTSLAIAANRGPIFVGTLVVGKGGATKANASGVWAMDFRGKLRTLFRVGDKLPVDNNPQHDKTLKSFTLLKASVGATGVTRSFNDNAKVVWQATFTDETTAIVKTEVP